jgi:hypothetical protein
MEKVASLLRLDHLELVDVSSDDVLTSRTRLIGLCGLLLFALAETVYCRHTMQSDGISYLDMGDAILRGDWSMAVNAYWSPLYPFLQGLALKLLRPGAYSQFTVVHFVNLLIYVFAMASYDFLLRASLQVRRPDADKGRQLLPPWAVFALGYTVFLWSSLSLITLERVSPDMLMAGFVYLAVAVLLQIWQRPAESWRFAVLGIVLGFGYLAKAPMFLLAFLFFVVLWIVIGNWRRATLGVLIAGIAFLVVAGPWVIALSKAKGRLTFGDSGRINYVLMVNGATPSWYFQNVGSGAGHYLHPVRRIFDAPPIYEFAGPIKGTIPVWYDPSYWAAGATPRLHLKRQLQVMHRYVMLYVQMLFSAQAALFVGVVVLFFLSGSRYALRHITARWPIWLIGLAGLGMYSLVAVEMRYVAVFFTLLWVGLFSGLTVQKDRDNLRIVSVVTLAVVIAIVAPLAITASGQVMRSFHQRHVEWEVEEQLRGMGVRPGDRVGRIGGRFGTDWARLLGVSVVAEIPRTNAKEFWSASPQLQNELIERFRRLGVTTLVAEQIPPCEIYTPGPDWQKLSDGTYYALRIK